MSSSGIPAFAKAWEVLSAFFFRGDATTAITTAKTQGLAAAVGARAPKPEDIANGR